MVEKNTTAPIVTIGKLPLSNTFCPFLTDPFSPIPFRHFLAEPFKISSKSDVVYGQSQNGITSGGRGWVFSANGDLIDRGWIVSNGFMNNPQVSPIIFLGQYSLETGLFFALFGKHFNWSSITSQNFPLFAYLRGQI